jgi:uncharacterized cupin superfamily protein
MKSRVKLPAIDPQSLPVRKGSLVPTRFRKPVEPRLKRALGDPGGLTQFGVNLVELPPGCWSSLRHWHSEEDELVYILEGELVLVTDEGEQSLAPGLAAAFPAGKPDGHHLINRGSAPARYLEVGSRSRKDRCYYPGLDLVAAQDEVGEYFANKKGERY